MTSMSSNKEIVFLFVFVVLVLITSAKEDPVQGDTNLGNILESVELEVEVETMPKLPPHPDALLTVPELIIKYGYPAETHHILTEDGYILGAHRIPDSPQCQQDKDVRKRVIFLQHGLLADSSSWVISGVSKALGYKLADACYDVWMGNFRGSTYSRNHTTMDPVEDKEKFYDFSLHDIGYYDVAANIDYTLRTTSAEELYYVGHSMGTTTFFILMAERPEYNRKIKLMNALAPVAFMKNAKSPIRLIAPIANETMLLLHYFGIHEFLPSDEGMAWLGSAFCEDGLPTQPICINIVFLMCGYNKAQMDTEMLPIVMGHNPAGTSAKVVVHYAQGIVSNNTFRQFDYGPYHNSLKYGQEVPPDYKLSQITAPIALYWAENDWLADKYDVLRFSMELKNLVRNYRIEDDLFNHVDFIWAIDQQSLVNQPVMEFMDEYENETEGSGTGKLDFGLATIILFYCYLFLFIFNFSIIYSK